MACATLKRNLDWESMAQTPAKRRRCAPFVTTPSTSPGIKITENKAPSILGETISSNTKLTPEQMVQVIYDEVKRYQRRGQLRMASAAAPCSSSSGSEGDSSPPHRAHSQHPTKVYNRALFTFKQVRAICDRMLREQEAALRAEYETALSNKLAEQYEQFVRFNLDQVQRRPPPSCMPHGMDMDPMHQDLVPSYLS